MRYLVRYSLGASDSEITVSPDRDDPEQPDWDEFWSIVGDMLYQCEEYAIYEPQHVEILDHEKIDE